MRAVTLPGTDLVFSKFVFGTAGLFNAGSWARRQRLLFAAADQGFSHFDTAPLYGFGTAERDLSPLLRARPELTVTSKVGLYPPGGADQRAVAVLARKAAGRLLPKLRVPRPSFDLVRARRSLEGSLRRLGRDRIDLYLLHEPIVDVVDRDRWIEWLSREVDAGRIRWFGVAGVPAAVTPFVTPGTPLAAVVQTQDSLDATEAEPILAAGRPLQLTYGYVSAARARNDPRPTTELLRAAVRRNATGAILVTTNRAERLPQYARALEGSG